MTSIRGIATEFHVIDESAPVYLIAEIGLNHNGDAALARDSIDAAAAAGASAVKFQLFDADYFIDARATLGDGPPGSLREFFRGFQLPRDTWADLARHARAKRVDFFCSIFDSPSLALHRELRPPLIKIASCDITNRPLLKAARAEGLPVLLSTGTADEPEVARAVEWLRGVPLVLLQCVSAYPAEPGDYNLKVLARFRERFGLPVGISDHCPGNAVSLAAIALGACAVERHFTLDRSLPGPDHALSLEPAEFLQLANDARAVRAALAGDGIKRATPAEDGPRRFGRRSLYCARDVRAGQAVGADDLLPLRPGGGIGPEHAGDLVGRIWARDAKAGDPLVAGLVGDA